MDDKWAAIDIGSNTVQLLVAESVDNHFRPHLFALRTTRLGNCGPGGLLSEGSIAATLDVLTEYRDMLAGYEIRQVRVIATSAVRDAANRDLLLNSALALTGWRVEVLSGEEEARLSFLGAAGPLLAQGAQRIVMIDIGGSSSELLRWQDGVIRAVSADVGALRAMGRNWGDKEIMLRLSTVIKAQEEDAGVLVLGVGGTITTAAGLLLGCLEYDRDTIEGYNLTLPGVESLLDTLLPLDASARRAFSPLLERRGDIIVEGLLILRAFFRILGFSRLTVSGGGVLDGCLIDLRRKQDGR